MKLISTAILIFFSVSLWAQSIAVGSKKFTENVILGEIISQLIRSQDINVAYKKQLGGTRVLWNALLAGDIDIYPEYTGTIQKEILHQYNLANQADITGKLKTFQVRISAPLGFNNTYALGMKKETAGKYKINSISDLRNYPDLHFGFTNEFLDREDGWKGLRMHYGLPQDKVRGLDHDLAYYGLESGSVDLIDLYSTDAEIQYYNIYSLKDDQQYFPRYNAVFLYRTDITDIVPNFDSILKMLDNAIPESTMIAMNAASKIEQIPENVIAARFLENQLQIQSKIEHTSQAERIWRRTIEHLLLVSISLTAAILFSIPLGILATINDRLEKIILGITGIIQTIPSLALLVFMIPLLGIGGPPAILALFLYSLLPIVRNTFTGIKDISASVMESAIVLGLSSFARLRLIELPVASRSILAGIKTSAVINVGTATLGALIGAGGYGQPILTGIRLDNIGLILEGAVPAALLALLVQAFFDLLDKIIVPKGLQT